MTVARGPPHYLLHNGVGLDDVEHMAKALLDNLVKQRGSVDFTVLSHLHNLLPFAVDRILAADPKVNCLAGEMILFLWLFEEMVYLVKMKKAVLVKIVAVSNPPVRLLCLHEKS